MPDIPDGYVLRVNGLVLFFADLYSEIVFIEYFSFPDIVFLKPRVSGSIVYDSLIVDESEVLVWVLTLSGVAGPPYDLDLFVEVDTDVLELLSVEVISVE